MESIENISSGKEKLHQLESEGLYLFHGSPTADIEEFELRQSTHIVDIEKPHEMINDGEPAISATPYADIAIFRSIINRKNIDKIDITSSFGSNSEGELEFSVSNPEILEKARGGTGFVYVFDKNNFAPYSRDGVAHESGMEWRSYKQVKPIQVVPVNFDDMPELERIKIV